MDRDDELVCQWCPAPAVPGSTSYNRACLEHAPTRDKMLAWVEKARAAGLFDRPVATPQYWDDGRYGPCHMSRQGVDCHHHVCIAIRSGDATWDVVAKDRD